MFHIVHSPRAAAIYIRNAANATTYLRLIDETKTDARPKRLTAEQRQATLQALKQVMYLAPQAIRISICRVMFTRSPIAAID